MKCDLIYFKILIEKLKLIGVSAKILFKYKVFEFFSKIYAMLLYKILVIILSMTTLFFLSVFLALWLGDLLGKNYYGFLIIFSFYLTLLFLLYIFRMKFISKITSKTIKRLFLLDNQ